MDGYFLSCINNPNAAGSACNYVSNAIDLLGGYCFAGLPNTFWLAPDAIVPASGNFTICLGTTLGLSAVSPGGTWSSSNAAVASVDATESVSGMAAGTANITYHHICGPSFVTVTVGPMPTPITGVDEMCAYLPNNFTNSVSGGVWSSNSTVAIVTPLTGVVTGMAAGTAIITYAMGSCKVTKNILVKASSKVYVADTLCVGATLYPLAVGTGTWSSNTAVGSISMGVLTGVSPGTTVISFILFNGCYGTKQVTVVSCATTGVRRITSSEDVRIYPNPSTGQFRIMLPCTCSEAELRIYDMPGRLKAYRKMQLTNGRSEVDVRDLPKGNYIIHAEAEGIIYRSIITVAD